MKSTSFKFLQAFLWFVCVFHLMVGIGLNVSSRFPEILASYYGAQVDWTPQFAYILKPLGAFMFVLGVLAAVAARNPLKNTMIVYGFVILFAARAVQRFMFREEIYEALAIAPGRNMTAMVLFFVLAASLFALYRLAEKGTAELG